MHQQIEIGANIAHYRRRAALSAEQLAALAGNGLTRSVIANLENGRKRDVTVAQLLAVSLALGVSPAALMFDLSEPYDTLALAHLPGGTVTAAPWLAHGWFGGQIVTNELAASIDDQPYRSAGDDEPNQMLFEQISERDRLLTRERYLEDQLANVRAGEGINDGLRRDARWSSTTSDEENLVSLLVEVRAALHRIERVLQREGVDPSTPHVSRGSYF